MLTFLQFAVWGSYLVSLGQYLGSVGLGAEIRWFYAVGGFVALFMPALVGAIADRYLPAQATLGLCHLCAALAMFFTWRYTQTVEMPQFSSLFVRFAIATAFFIPSVSLCNSVSFSLLKNSGYDPVKSFPSIRIWGTIGFVAAMWFVNSAWSADGSFGMTLSDSSPHAMQRFQYTSMQLLVAAALGFVTAVYSLSLPTVRVWKMPSELRGWRGWPVIGSFRLLGDRRLLSFFIFSMLLGVALQVNNAFVAPYLTHFRGVEEYATTFGANNATLLSSLSQISEALWILPVGVVLSRLGIKWTVLVAMLAWVVNFVCLAFGNTGGGLWLIIFGMAVYGIAFNFFNVAGALFIDRNAPISDRSAAQGFLMMMTKGVGATVGMIGAGYVINHFCHWEMVGDHRYFMGEWTSAWMVCALYCLAVGLAFLLFFKTDEKRKTAISPVLASE